MALKPVTFGPFIRGVDASTGILSQPKGSVPRASNFLLSKRGALKTCDGSGIVNLWGGPSSPARGRAMCEFFYQPIGVAPYYLRLMKALDQPLGKPYNLTATPSTGGSLTSGQQYFYKVTAIDGVGGETLGSTEANATPSGGNLSVTLVWNVVPNAVGYNVYRSTTTGTEILLVGTGLPVPPPSSGSLTVSFVDDGSEVTPTFTVVSIVNSLFHGAPTNSYQITLSVSQVIQTGTTVVYAAGSNASFNGSYVVTSQPSSSVVIVSGPLGSGGSSNGGSISISQFTPSSDTTQQTALYSMPPAANGAVYSNSNIVALFPADVRPIDGSPGGGGGGFNGNQGSTPSGGIPGNVSLIPQMVQFTNQAVLALGNGFPPQVYSDSTGTPDNPAISVPISSISVDSFGVVTVTTSSPHKINSTQGIGANVIIAGVTDNLYNLNGHGASAFVVLSIPSATSVTLFNSDPIGHAPSSGGTLTVSTIPVISTFVPSYPLWTTSVSYAVNSIIVPTVSNGHYYKAVQAGTSGGTQPTFPTTTGGQIADGSVIWRESGLLNSAAPPPPGCAHIAVYAGSVWMFNTATTNTSTGLDGPTSLRMCDVNNLNSWNPINQAFLDKDDGIDGMGLATFTITAQGIPPQGSLVAFKLYATYQIVGVFGSSNFAIQRAETDMGLVAPRTLQFSPGFGLMRQTHLGYAVFDGVTDRVISQQIQPYLYASDDQELSDITPMDPSWMAISQSSQTANPPMYISAIPVGTSNGNLTRILCFDLVLKAWCIVDLPFPISTLAQARSAVSPVITLMGSANDGSLQRWQADDENWSTITGGSITTLPVSFSVRTPVIASKDAYVRLYTRRVIIRGQQGAPAATLSMNPNVSGVSQGSVPVPMPSSGDFQTQAPVGVTSDLFYADLTGSGQVTIDAMSWDIVPKPAGVLAGRIS